MNCYFGVSSFVARSLGRVIDTITGKIKKKEKEKKSKMMDDTRSGASPHLETGV